MRLIALLVVLAATPSAQPVFAPDSVRADLAMLQGALAAYHPGLDRYGQRADLAAAADSLDGVLAQRTAGLSEAEAVVAFARVLHVAADGHTVIAPRDQSDGLRERLWGGLTALPFAFRVLAKPDRLVVTRDLTDRQQLPRGTEVVEIDGRPVGHVLDRLQALAPGDGRGTDALRRARLAVPETEVGPAEWPDFDDFYGLVFPPSSDSVSLTVRFPGTDRLHHVAAEWVSRGERAERMRAAGALVPPDEGSWTTRALDDSTALVRLGTFATWGFETPADTLLARTFRALRQRGVRRLVLDVRGVVGGNLGARTVARYLTTDPLGCLGDVTVVASDRPDPAFSPYLAALGGGDGWKQPLPVGAVEPRADGRFRLLVDPGCAEEPAQPNAFGGPVAVLADEWNESATFSLLRLVRDQRLGVVVGRPAGGNLRGLTAGVVLRLTLPRTGVVVTLPLLAGVPPGAPPDAALEPDVRVEWTADDVAAGRDPDIEAALCALGGG